ncbi:S8 family serine peptidase [Orenia marismortui]|uniref:S8 family serine peptidase n=1 Tax=Orenia marismortui TaxID=46469 RepID=UPI00037495DA|nr:S8 family serine peptidase [Orenia marismortui]
MKKNTYLMLIMMVAMVLCSGFYSLEVNAYGTIDSNDYVEGQLVISLQEPAEFSIQNTDIIALSQISTMEQNNFKVIDSILPAQNNYEDEFKAKVIKNMGFVYLVEYSTAIDSIDQAIKELEGSLKNSGLKIRFIEPNYKYKFINTVSDKKEFTPTSMHNNQKWNYEMIKAPKAWEITTGSQAVKVAILDSGIDPDHINLENILDKNLRKNFSSGPDEDLVGHGTHVGGTVASYGEVSGVMQDVSLISVKVGCTSGPEEFAIIKGLTYAAEIDADVVNMSFSGPYNQGIEEAATLAYNDGTILVAAAGNSNSSNIRYPAAYPNIIAVGAVDSTREKAPFSNYGEKLELMAPGVDIYSTIPDDLYALKSGTSMSSPHVVGVAGLMRAVNPDITPEEAREILKNTAQEAGDKYYYGYGIVDAYEAVKASKDLNTPQSNYEQVYFRGTPNSWDTTAMELVDDYTWETTITFTDNSRFKFDIYGDWSLNFGDNEPRDGYADQNGADIYVYDGGTYKLTFNDNTKQYSLSKNQIKSSATISYTINTGSLEELLYSKIKLKKDGVYYGEYIIGNNSNAIARTIINDLPVGNYEAILDLVKEGYKYTGNVAFNITAGGQILEENMAVTKEEYQNYQSNYDQVYFRGTPNSWDNQAMELVADHTWETTVTFAANSRFKFDIYGDWSLNFGDNNKDGYADQDGDDIYVYDAGTYKVTFYDDTKQYILVKQ